MITDSLVRSGFCCTLCAWYWLRLILTSIHRFLDIIHTVSNVHLWSVPLLDTSMMANSWGSWWYSYYYLVANYLNPAALLSGVWCVLRAMCRDWACWWNFAQVLEGMHHFSSNEPVLTCRQLSITETVGHLVAGRFNRRSLTSPLIGPRDAHFSYVSTLWHG